MRKRIIPMSIATMLIFGTVSFASETLSININDYKNYAYSVLEDKMGVTKSDLTRDTEGLKDLESYVKNCIDMGVDINEFKSMLNKKIEPSIGGKVCNKKGKVCSILRMMFLIFFVTIIGIGLITLLYESLKYIM